jgi:hypothetical protein
VRRRNLLFLDNDVPQPIVSALWKLITRIQRFPEPETAKAFKVDAMATFGTVRVVRSDKGILYWNSHLQRHASPFERQAQLLKCLEALGEITPEQLKMILDHERQRRDNQRTQDEIDKMKMLAKDHGYKLIAPKGRKK